MPTKQQPQVVDVGSLDRRAQIQQQTTTQDGFGQPQQTWTTVYTAWAGISIQHSQLLYETAQFVSKVTHRITLRWTSSLVFQPPMRAIYTEATTGVVHTYNIEAILNKDQRNRILVILCYESRSQRVIEAGLFNLLSTTASITELCGTRIYPLLLPTAPTLPAITYQIVAGTASPTLSTSGFQRWRFQFDCWGEDYSDAVSLRAALIGALNGYQGTLSDGTVLQNAQFIQPIDFFEHEALQYRCAVEFYLHFDFQA